METSAALLAHVTRDMTFALLLVKSKLSDSVFLYGNIFSYKDNEFAMLQLLSSYGPLTVSVDASNWVNYQGGIIQFHCGEVPRNHAVQIVGYDLTCN